MPHKVNPIDFENAEGNFGVANSLLHFFSAQLPISRWQRDLTDSTVLRNLGVAFGHVLLALKSLEKGIRKLEIRPDMLEADLNANIEVLAEAVQTVMRKYGIKNPYEKLKELTRGKRLTRQDYEDFVMNLELPQDIKQSLLQLTPGTYTGIAQKIVEMYS
jgi:adenylosuccinate lyase